MILINKYEPEISIDDAFVNIVHQYNELKKIYEFIDLPEQFRDLEKNNSAILRNYYSNAIDHNLLDIKSVKYIINKNVKPNSLSERAIYQYMKAEEYLNEVSNEPLSLSMVYHLHKILITDLYNTHSEVSLFNKQVPRQAEKLNTEAELQLESLFEFLNNDTEFHPIVQSWMLNFRILGMQLFAEGKSRIACLLQNFWLKKNDMDLHGLLTVEHEVYLNKIEYRSYFIEHRPLPDEKIEGEDKYDLNHQLAFGLKMHSAQLNRVETLLQSYFRKQVDYEKLNPRQKNIMNYVFKRGYKLKDIDDSIINKRQKLIMYIIQHRGFISTKDLVSEFGCNRKTIQRDFTLLLELGLVKIIGAGSALRYALNLREHQSTELDQYNADFIKDSEEQMMKMAMDSENENN